jgi:uncharacterized membrane protein YadS
LTSDDRRQRIAAVVKLVRNLFMAGVIPLMALLYHGGGDPATASQTRPPWHQAIPLFVVGFLAMGAVRSVGDLGARPFLMLDRDTWRQFLGSSDTASGWCLATAMAGVGLGTGLARLRILGWRPLCVGLAAAALVGSVSFGLITLLVHHS